MLNGKIVSNKIETTKMKTVVSARMKSQKRMKELYIVFFFEIKTNITHEIDAVLCSTIERKEMYSAEPGI